MADTLAKEAAQDHEERNIVYDRVPLSTIANAINEEGLKKWQTQWERAEKGAQCRSFFPTGRAEAKNTDPNNTGVYCLCQWPWEDKNLFAQIQINRQPDVPLQ